ncbi:MAG: 50S ribosomal protein L15 [Candidatus Altiarchaeota archaeon]|nr:50S ribosomal protein L15 [Candidatus Altiarchaeota archaeon]
MAQKDRKIGKKRGSRTCGYGNAKKHRGSGSRGGRGMAGSGGHKKIKMNIEHPNYFGKRGFKRNPRIIVRKSIINLSDIEKKFDGLVKDGVIKKEKDGYALDASLLGVQKVLGSGSLSHAIQITAESFSASAKEEIEKAGGKALVKD